MIEIERKHALLDLKEKIQLERIAAIENERIATRQTTPKSVLPNKYNTIIGIPLDTYQMVTEMIDIHHFKTGEWFSKAGYIEYIIKDRYKSIRG